MLRTCQIADLLPDRHHAEIVFPRTPSHVGQEHPTGGMSQQQCCLVDDKQSLAPNPPGGVPHMTADQMDGQRLQLLRQFADVEYDKWMGECYVGLSREDSAAK